MAKTRYLAVYEHDTVANAGALFAVSPNNASGISIPAFRTVTAVPASGTVAGEALLDTNTGSSYVWDGRTWQSIVPPTIKAYASDAAVMADAAANSGTYGFSRTTGNLFVRYDTGGGVLAWRNLGFRTYPTQAGLLADTPVDGSTGYAADTASVFHRVGGAWVPGNFVVDTAANIGAKTSVAGQVAFASDTHKWLAADGAGGWVGMPWREYATETALVADTPVDGTFAIALDTGSLFYRSAGNWLPANRFAVPSGVSEPTVAVTGNLFHNTVDHKVKIYDGAAWVALAPVSIGDLADVDITGGPSDKQPLAYNAASRTWKPSSRLLDDLSDVDTTTTAPSASDVLTWNGTSSKWVPGKGASVVVGAEPAANARFSGLLWYDGARLWIWDTAATTWVET